MADAEDAAAFRSGLRVAGFAASHGFLSGAPVPLPDGRLTVELPEGVLALLQFVPGRSPSVSSEADMRRAGVTLARAHLALGNVVKVSEQHAWPWALADECLQGLSFQPEIRDAAAGALQDIRDVTERFSLRVGVVHGDPGLDAFRLRDEAPNHDGLIDWAAAMQASRCTISPASRF
ncbi:hypothetical protein ACWDSL_53405 [Streptomyces sp. NPDC000941]